MPAEGRCVHRFAGGDSDYLRLHNQEAMKPRLDEQPGEVKYLARRFGVIKAFAAAPRFKLAKLAKYKAASAFLLDGYHSGLYGGTGRTADWGLAREAKRYGRVIVAGGLRPDNVAQAIAEAQPFGIDVASGVEARPGKKDPRALRQLMREVEAANRAGDESRRIDSSELPKRSKA